MLFKFAGDIHELSTLQDLGIDDVPDDCLVFARQILIQQIDQFRTRYFLETSSSRFIFQGDFLQGRVWELFSDLPLLEVCRRSESPSPYQGHPTKTVQNGTARRQQMRATANWPVLCG